MAFLQQSSPHTLGGNQSSRVMRLVLLGCVPGILVHSYFFPWGLLWNLILCVTTALVFESLVLKLRQRPVLPTLKDYSAILSAVLLALCLPPYLAWWIPVIATFFAILIGKQLYGGLGQNLFNPAMVGYLVVLFGFPAYMGAWAPIKGSLSYEGYSFVQSVQAVFTGFEYDALTQATPLEQIKFREAQLIDEVWLLENGFSSWAGIGWGPINLAFLIGGIFLLQQKIIRWHAPVAFLVSLSLCSIFFYQLGRDSNGGPLFHLFSGGTMLGAFFILTDPVSSATSQLGRLWFGAIAGVIVYVIRTWGGFQDGVAFAVLLMNFAAPWIDYYTQPRTYGHSKTNKGYPGAHPNE